jgi:hypothetical protein
MGVDGRYPNRPSILLEMAMKPDDPESEETRKFLDWISEKYKDIYTDLEWRRLPKEMRQSIIERERLQFRKEQEYEAKQWAKESEAKWEEQKKIQEEIDQIRRDKEYEQDKRKEEQAMREQERKKEREQRELLKEQQKEQEKLRKQQEADAIKQAEEDRWKPRHFKP